MAKTYKKTRRKGSQTVEKLTIATETDVVVAKTWKKRTCMNTGAQTVEKMSNRNNVGPKNKKCRNISPRRSGPPSQENLVK